MKKLTLNEVVSELDVWLEPNRFKDYCHNGIQVEGTQHITHVATAVTASLDAIEQAVELGAEMLLVHHGLFWHGAVKQLTSTTYTRCRRLMMADMALVAYHLPLDGHAVLGNNACLAELLSFEIMGDLDFLSPSIGHWGHCAPQSVTALAAHLESVLGQSPLVIACERDAPITKVAWCSGAAQDALIQAHAKGVDAFISGEVRESTYHLARELGVHYFAAGHHATERYGVQALGKKLAQTFSIEHTYIELRNPV